MATEPGIRGFERGSAALDLAGCRDRTACTYWKRGERRAVEEGKPTEAEELARRYQQLYEEGNYGEAIPLAEQACSLLDGSRMKSPTKVATCFNDLGLPYHAIGEYGKAKILFSRALVIRERQLGPRHPDVATVLREPAATLGEGLPTPRPASPYVHAEEERLNGASGQVNRSELARALNS